MSDVRIYEAAVSFPHSITDPMALEAQLNAELEQHGWRAHYGEVLLADGLRVSMSGKFELEEEPDDEDGFVDDRDRPDPIRILDGKVKRDFEALLGYFRTLHPNAWIVRPPSPVER